MSATFTASGILSTSKNHLLLLLLSYTPNLDDCNSIYLNLPQKQISRPELLQNSFDRAVIGTSKTEHITPVLEYLHLLKIEERIH